MSQRPNKTLCLLWRQQNERCIWCGLWCPLWGFTDRDYARHQLSKRLGRTARIGEIRAIRATREHLVPKCLGGTNGRHNLAMACAACNAKRGADPAALQPDPDVLALLAPSKRAVVSFAMRGTA